MTHRTLIGSGALAPTNVPDVDGHRSTNVSRHTNLSFEWEMQESESQVLVVEDNPAMSGVLEFSLRQSGYDVHICSNGAKAIDAVQAKRFLAIITDYQMPGANGDEVVRAARSCPHNAATPIILCSAKGLEIDVDALSDEYELAAVICKPFSPREVMVLVASLNLPIADRTRACC